MLCLELCRMKNSKQRRSKMQGTELVTQTCHLGACFFIARQCRSGFDERVPKLEFKPPQCTAFIWHVDCNCGSRKNCNT